MHANASAASAASFKSACRKHCLAIARHQAGRDPTSDVLTLDPCSEGLAGATGLEPAASCVTGRRSNQLNYAPAWDRPLTFTIVPSNSARFPLVPSRSLPFHLAAP